MVAARSEIIEAVAIEEAGGRELLDCLWL